MEIDYHKYQYHIEIPPFDKYHHCQLHNLFLPYWKNFWTRLLHEIGSDEKLCEDEINWQDRITYITHRNQVVAAHFIACYEMSEFAHSEYAKRYLPEGFAEAYANEGGFINTLQYLSVDPSYCYRKTRINFAGVLMDLCKFHQQELHAQRTITVARKSVGAHNLARKFGFTELCTATKHCVDVSVMQADKPQRHSRQSITEIADYLWENRELPTGRNLLHEHKS